jgi:ribonuclease HIII
MRWIGCDESGKGDYFGYLVAAGVVADEPSARKLKDMGVKDSKQLSDAECQRLSKLIPKMCKTNIVKISPEKYNALYAKYKNMNNILAWCHATVIENLLDDSIDFVIVDKFADEKVLKSMVEKKKKPKKLIQRVRGEEDIAVAAASIIARAEFLRTLRALSLEVGIKLPKGAAHLDEALREIRDKYDKNVLNVIAKVHFKTTKKMMK